MSDDLSASLKTLRSTAAHLNKLTDQANESVRFVEDFLSQQCGISTHVKISLEANALANAYMQRAGAIPQSLEYRKIGHHFRIAVVWIDEIEHEERITPWSDCSRELKLETIKKLPDLLHALLNRLNNQIKETEKVNESVSKVVQTLTGKGG